MTYDDCRVYLDHVQTLGIKLGLENVRALLTELGEPQKACPSVVVAGSNGKGSVCAMLARIATLEGCRVGLYTSPHLIDYEERFRIGDSPIPREDFRRILTFLRSRIESLLQTGRLAAHPTHFEILTCLAWLYFRQEKTDLAVMEVGMGGRFDAVNAADPILGVITTISLEHQAFLGTSLAEIAGEKAGIIKPGVPVVCGVEAPEAIAVIRDRAREAGAPLRRVSTSRRPLRRIGNRPAAPYEFNYSGRVFLLKPSLPGDHQGRNAAAAAAAAVELGRIWKPLSRKSILAGVATTRWEGRLETAGRSPLVLLDGAHNPEGAGALREYIREAVTPPAVLVFAAMRDKAVDRVAAILFPEFEKIVLTGFPYHRAATPGELAAAAPGFQDRLLPEPDPARAFRLAVEAAGPGGTVVVCGSLFLVGEIKRGLRDGGLSPSG
jgi:dihydrofolate synthase/folylpolyglutamate synthase